MANLQGIFMKSSRNPASSPWAPNHTHKISALQYTGTALSLARREVVQGVDVLVATNLLLSFVEMEMGTFEGLRRYLKSIGQLIFRTHHKLEVPKCSSKLLPGIASSRPILKHVAGQTHRPDLAGACGKLLEELGSLSARFHARKPPRGLPLSELGEGTVDVLSTAQMEILGDIEPIYFESHEQAMEAADYVFCRLVCDDAPLQRRSLATTPRRPAALPSPGLSTDWPCNEPKDMIIIDGFLDRLIAIGSGWEDSTFPTAVTRSILELTHHQLARGRTILLASTIEGEVTETETIHASDRMTVYSLYGMEVDGRAFEEFVDLTSDSAT
ncbi:hypothetical protein SAPIO_CDS10319 [Scedosporium apiospermum]|uniref:Uncharacterized protein n=1 Tax=Pseudallescheria apiosperma TaxID=563466 RepID=A0A084FV55_PSEDA|nr:uncharacterized protein SAPIO_CDS10319 [Scedosporium apiospermum]KEZ38967.1 hypothetical protein SAPIO_CDS10319 [Scedosporium apiospermum]